jgi:hypothetical protein
MVEDEKEIRQLMTIYAVNDCLAVTKLAHKIIPNELLTPPTTIYCDALYEVKQTTTNHEQYEKSITLCSTNVISYRDGTSEINVHNELFQNVLTEIHAQNESYEFISDDELPEIILPHFSDKQDQSKGKGHYQNEVHVQHEFCQRIEMISDEDEQQIAVHNKHRYHLSNQHLTKNQRKNRKKRRNRYRFQVVRNIYHRFTISQIKEILIHFNIHYANIKIVGRTSFIGLKNKVIQERVNQLLSDDMLTKEHYYRLQKRRIHRKRK